MHSSERNQLLMLPSIIFAQVDFNGQARPGQTEMSSSLTIKFIKPVDPPHLIIRSMIGTFNFI